MPRKTKQLTALKALLDQEASNRNSFCELNATTPDPLMVAKLYNDETIALICALFAYGNAKAIVKFLQTLDFSLLDATEDEIKISMLNHLYRFQTPQDVTAIFVALKRLSQISSIENIVFDGYKKNLDVFEGISCLIETLQKVYPYSSKGYDFLIGKPNSKTSPYKRYMMYFRWMTRNDCLDMGLWRKIPKKDLIIPLDVHTFNVSRKLGLLKRKTYDKKAAIELTNSLKMFDANDPIKYDFALYRIGQESKLENFLLK